MRRGQSDTHIAAVVGLEAVVSPDGTVTLARVVKSLHPDLDEQALVAVKQWRFVPGMRAGKPVPVRVSVEMTFTLKTDR